MIKKADILLGLFLALLCLSSLFLLGRSQVEATVVTITVDGQQYGTYELSKDQSIQVDQNSTDHTNRVIIESGTVWMESSSCSNQVCVDQGTIRRSNQTIVCLPNKVVVSIDGSTGQMDAVSY